MTAHSTVHRQQRGLTLIELMIALLISSLLIGMVFAIYVRMSVAYRGQTEISQLQQSLRAAKRMIVQDTRSAGFLIPNGVQTSAAVKTNLGAPALPILQPVMVANNVDDASTDRLRLYYADTSAMAKINSGTAGTSVIVDDADNFAVGDVVVIVGEPTYAENNNSQLEDPTTLVRHNACLLQITDITGTTPATLTFDSAAGAPYNDGGTGHCIFTVTPPTVPPAPPPAPVNIDIMLESTSMIYKFKARSYRIDPTRKDSSVLQVSENGELDPTVVPLWQDIGVGFTDFQIAYRAYEEVDTDTDLDGDGDDLRDWYSGSVAKPDDAEITQVNISLTARSTRDLNVVSTTRTPEFYDSANPDHNPLGDSEGIDLPDALARPQFRGNHVYRYTSVRVDLRNVGVGR